jgi:hypothetical protein
MIECPNAFVLGRANERIKHIFVIASLGLQSHERNIKRGADAHGNRTAGHTRQRFAQERNGFAVVHFDQLVGEFAMQTDTGRPVHELSTNGGVDPPVHGQDATTLDHVGNNRGSTRHGLARIELSVNLHPYLDQIDRVDADTGKGR